MKRVLITTAVLAFISLPAYLKAQEQQEKKETEEKIEIREKIEKKEKPEKKEKAEKKETQEIIIRNKGEKDLKLKVEINGDEVTVNGKPLAEFKDGNVTINKRKMIIRDGAHDMTFNFSPDGFAFSEDFLKERKNFLKEGKMVTRPFLGVTTEKVAEGAKVMEIVKESAAEKAGLKKDDIITKVGDEEIEDGESLSRVIGAKKPKDEVKISYLRNGKKGTVKATLGEKKMKSPVAVYGYGSPRADVRSFSIPKIQSAPNVEFYGDRFNNMEGFAPGNRGDLAPLLQFENSFARQKRLGLKIQDTEEGGNVKVINVEEGSAAEKAGLKKDDIITEIGGVKVNNTDDAREQLVPSESKTAYTIKAKRNGTEMSFEVKFPKKLKTANL